MKLTRTQIADLLEVFAKPLSSLEMDRVESYLELLLRWNTRTNLTAIRDSAEIVRRHFGESFFLESYLGPCVSLLDIGSGAGFPGLAVQIRRPELSVTLAESQAKKSAFLREAIRVMGLPTEVWSAKVEAMPAERRFSAVCLRAVDKPEFAREQALKRLEVGGTLLELRGCAGEDLGLKIRVPGSERRYLYVSSKAFHVEQ